MISDGGIGSDGIGVGPVVPPSQRPRRERRAARVVVVAADETLLTERFDPGLPSVRWWTCPGGGIDPGESAVDAAIRELAEELGIDVDASSLVGPVARRVVVHGYTDQVVRQAEDYFLYPCERFEPRVRLMTERERVSTGATRWWPLAERIASPAWHWDDVATLWALRDEPERWPVDLGEQEQSAVPV